MSEITQIKQFDACLVPMAWSGCPAEDIFHQLEREGVKPTVDPSTALIQVVDERRNAALAELGPLQAGVASRVRHMEQADLPRRIWAHDPTVWAQDAAGQAAVRRGLGWLEAPQRSLGLLPGLARLVKDVQAAGYTHAVLLGMGGSTLAPEVLSQVIGSREINGSSGLELHILDSTDPAQVRAAARWSVLEKTLYIVSSKSGETSEVNAFFDFFWQRARHKLGDRAGEHFIAITDPRSGLERLAHEHKFRSVLLADPNVRGLYSSLTALGLAPAALLGADVNLLLSRAAWMAGQCSPGVPAGRSPGLVLGAVLAEAAAQGRNKLTFLADSTLAPFGAWLEQLIAESSGKAGSGIVPVDGEPFTLVKKYSPDRLFVYFRQDGALDSRAQQLRALGHPVLSLGFMDPHELGAEFFRWEFATAAACAALGVNSFDQPEVQDSKDLTRRKVAAFQQKRSLEEGEPAWEGPGGRVYGWNFPGLNGSRTLADVVRNFITQAQDQEYIALNAFVPRSPRTLRKLQTLRARILKTSGRATTLGFGPRYLHSTGQLQKGGANTGLFLLVTQHPAVDVEIPGQEMTFGTLESAQALGDLEALLSRGRRAIRIHLVDGDLQDLLF